MISFLIAPPAPHVLCIGAHSDDIEIGCAGTLLQWRQRHPALRVCWVVVSTDALRAVEARKSADALLGDTLSHVILGNFQDGHFPAQFSEIKTFLSSVREKFTPDVVLTHTLDDRHQDHRLIAEMTWQVWRDQLILEYEIPKYESDLKQPNLYVPLDQQHVDRKLQHLMIHFESQRSKSWFREAVFSGLMHMRGIECRAESGCAEAFLARKVVLGG